jgi:hypothetical protein
MVAKVRPIIWRVAGDEGPSRSDNNGVFPPIRGLLSDLSLSHRRDAAGLKIQNSKFKKAPQDPEPLSDISDPELF